MVAWRRAKTRDMSNRGESKSGVLVWLLGGVEQKPGKGMIDALLERPSDTSTNMRSIRFLFLSRLTTENSLHAAPDCRPDKGRKIDFRYELSLTLTKCIR